MMDIAIERANAAGLPEVAGLLVYVSRERQGWRAEAHRARRLAAALYRVILGQPITELSEEDLLWLNELAAEEE